MVVLVKMTSQPTKVALWLFLALALGPAASEALRILGIFPVPGKSHFVMDERLMRVLAERGHQVDVYSHFPLKKPPPNYTDYSFRGSVPLLMNNMSYELFNSFASGTSMPRLLALLGDPVCGMLELPIFQKLIHDPPTDPPYDVVVIEQFMANCFLAFGQHLKVPMVMVVTTTLFEWLYDPLGNPTNLAVEPGVFAHANHPMSFFERVDNVLQFHWNVHSFNRHVLKQDAFVEKHFGPGYPNVVDMQKDVALTLVNYHHALNGVRAFTANVVPIGALHVVDSEDQLPKHVQTFLDESKNGFIYVSFGSMVRIETFPKPDIEAFYKTFQKIAPVRVLMKIAKPEELPPGLPSNVITYHWLPQVKVLKHKNIKAFVTHGGLMGTVESIYHGVPMIAFPLFGDQPFNVKSYVRRNMAIKLDRTQISEESFSKAVKEILSNPIYKRSAEKVGKAIRDVPLSPIDTAAFWVEYVVRHGKDALRPPVVDLPWWQASLLDVYAFLVSVALAAIFIIKLIITKFIRLLSPKQCPFSGEKIKKN